MANTVRIKRVAGGRYEIVGMAKKESPKSSKSRNKTKKNKHKHGKHSKSKSISPPNLESMKPTSHSRTTPPSDNLAIRSILNNPVPIAKSILPKNAITPEIIDICEYYPHKLKRPSPKKKTILKHQFNLKDIKRRNKRKSAVPRKGQQIDNKDPQRVEFSELSMIEIIRFLDENGMLDNESIMEIVDCPSPVWWEDAPGEDYCEEPIDRELVREALEGIRESPPPIEEDVQIRVQLLNKQLKSNDKLITKKSKLENILGNIKKRIIKIKLENGKANEMVNNNAKSDEIINNYSQYDTAEKNTDITSESRLSESSDGDILSDISANEEELLKHLETIEIPIKNPSPTKGAVKKYTSVKRKPIIVPKMPPLLKFPYQSASAEFSKLKCLTESLRSKNCTVTSATASLSETTTFTEASTSNDIPETIDSTETPKSGSFESKSISSSDDASGDFDSISDTNVRFLDDDDVEMLTCRDYDSDEVDGKVIDETNTNDQEDTVNMDDENDVNNELSEQISSWDKSELITVYSIVSPETDTEQEIIETRKTEEQKAKRPRKLKTNFDKYRDAKMIAFLKQNKKLVNRSESTTDKVSVNEPRPIMDFIRMPRNVASQRKLNVCNCSSVDCDCHSTRNYTFKSINGENKQKTFNSFEFRQNLG